jgi:PAS domain-containing protein
MMEGKRPVPAGISDGLDAAAGLRAAFDAIEEGACIIERLPEGTYRCLAMNPAMCVMFGLAI